jgi:hypothetical protein
MLGLSGIGWMFISLTFGYVVHEIMKAISSITGGNINIDKHKWVNIAFSLASLPMFIYAIIGIFLGPKWYIAPMFALGAFIVSGKILHWITAILVRNPNTLFNIVYPLFGIIQLASAILAYITWF